LAASSHALASRHDAVIAGDDPEAIHDARIAMRRLRANLATMAPLLPDGRVAELRSGLAWLGDAFGRVRDADVLLDRLRRRVAALEPEDARSAGHLLSGLGRDRAEGHRELIETLGSDRYAELIDACIRFSAAPPLETPEALARQAFPPLLEAEWSRLSRACRRLEQRSPDEMLHAARIAAKRARYGAEAIAPVFGGKARAFARRAKALQEVLGDHQDAVVAEAWLRERAIGSSSVAFAAGRIAAAETAERARVRAAWPKAWRSLSEKRLRFWR
jgi:CHAD domain-containing protein